MRQEPLGRHLPAVFVHGYNFFGASNPNQWDALEEAMRSWGWSAGMYDVRYYGCESGMDLDANQHGSHATHNPNQGNHNSDCVAGEHDYDTDIEHLGYHLAWTLYDSFTRIGQCVVIIAHSMGGLITRYAMQHVGVDGTFPDLLCVKGVATLGTPHNGHMAPCGGDFQSCTQMKEGSAFLSSLGSAPQGVGETKWIAIGSDDDWVVSASSAISVPSADRYLFYDASMNVHHANGKTYLTPRWTDASNDLPTHEADDRTAFAYYWDEAQQAIIATLDSPWPARVVDIELSAAGAKVQVTPYRPGAHRHDPSAAAVRAEPGVDYVFGGTCDDEMNTLEGASWTALVDGSWYEVTTDTVQIHNHPWYTEATVPGQSQSYTLRMTCKYGAHESYTEWQVTIESGYLASGDDFVVPAGSYYAVAFGVNAGQSAYFRVAARDFSTFNAGLIRSQDFNAYQTGQSVSAYCYDTDVDESEHDCAVAAGNYYLLVECNNSFADCDLEYWLRVS